VRHWPALDIPDADDLVLAALDDFSPTAIEERERCVRVFFATREQRDAALATLTGRQAVGALDVSDEDWAVRSQQSLAPIVVGRIRVVPDGGMLSPSHPLFRATDPHVLDIVIEPSMGFGTGHHATTRLCLTALQGMNLSEVSALDVGTGSGILAIAAARLGAARVHGIDYDADAVQSANENLALNPEASHVTFTIGDLNVAALPKADVVICNLTGTVLAGSAGLLLAATKPAGTLVLSGILAGEEDDVREAFSSAARTVGRAGVEIDRGSIPPRMASDVPHQLVCERQQEDEWVCLTMTKV